MAINESITKLCRKCGEQKTLDEFYVSSRNKSGRCVHCKTCTKAQASAWRAANPEKAKSAIAEYRKNNQDKLRASKAAWAEANRERVLKLKSEWNSANAHKRRIYEQNRRTRKLESGGKLSPGLADMLYKLQKGRCVCCGLPLGDNYHMDHIVPLALGGTNTDNNIQLLRAECNQKKYTKHPVDFMQSKGFLL